MSDPVIMALARAIEVASSRGPAPSHAVQLKAADMLGRRGAHSRDELARVWKIPGDGGERTVTLYLEPVQTMTIDWGDRPDDSATIEIEWSKTIVAAECDCRHHGELSDPDARSAIGACSHLLTALAIALVDGYEIKEDDQDGAS